MAETKNQKKIRATKQETFDTLKMAAPTLFGDKTYQDVAYFSDDTEDKSKILIVFNEE